VNGELDDLGDGHWRLRFVRHLAHPVDEVWRAVTEPDRLRSWFPQRVVGDLLTPGAPLSFEGERAGAFPGRVLRVEAPVLLEFLWGTDVLRLELVADGGACTLTFTDTIDELGKAARDGAGWHTCLDFLEVALGGTTPDFTSPERWQSVHPGYVRAFGPDASTVGPPGSA